MRHTFSLLSALIALTAAPGVLQAQSVDPAHALAQKFAVENQGVTRTAPAAASRPKDARVKTTSAKSILAPPPSADYEREMLDAARAEADARAQTSKIEQAKTHIPVPPASAPAAVPMQIKIEAKIAAPAIQVRTADAQTAKPAAVAPISGRATVLVVLSHTPERPGSLPRTFDPILCMEAQCYVSSGPASQAKPIAKPQALSTKNTITAGAGACAGKNQCAFRGVDISAKSQVEIVDLGLVRHEHREALDATIDKSCRVEDGDLVCDHPLTAPDYRIWIVPEDVAGAAGSHGLEAALADELPEPDIALDTDK